MSTAPKITHEEWLAALSALPANHDYRPSDIANKALATKYSLAEQQEGEYITAAQARELGVGKAEYRYSHINEWFICQYDCPYTDCSSVKYRAIKQAQPEPVDSHAELRAEYIRQRDAVPCELEFYSWERKDKGMADFAKLGVPPAFFPFHEYRCTDISCYVSKDGDTAIRMLRTNAQALQHKLGGTAEWYYPNAIKTGGWNLDFDGKGTYTYRTKAIINFLPPDPTEDERTYYEIGIDEGRKQALEDVANGFIKQKSWTQDMAHAVVQHAADEGALKSARKEVANA